MVLGYPLADLDLVTATNLDDGNSWPPVTPDPTPTPTPRPNSTNYETTPLLDKLISTPPSNLHLVTANNTDDNTGGWPGPDKP
jgi:hypothetical protein